MKISLTLLLLALFAAGCTSTPTAVPTVIPTTIPTAPASPTSLPTNTSLPPTPTTAPTNTPLPLPTNTVIPSSPTATVTNTRAPITAAAVTRTPTAAPPTEVVMKFAAPVPESPTTGDTRIAGSDDLVFKWQPVGALGSDECYLLTLRITNDTDQQYAEQGFIAANTCNDSGAGPVTFTLSRRSPAPDYAGLFAIANSGTPSTDFHVTWNVMVVQNKGADPNKPDPTLYVPISPVSDTLTFHLQG